MQYQIIQVTPFQENCSIIWCAKTQQGAIIDPGGEPELLKKAVAKLGVNITKILLTHGHLDHVGAAKSLASHYDVKIYGSAVEDAFLFTELPQQCAQFGFPYIAPFLPDQWLTEGDSIEIGDIKLNVLHCPGHTPGHIAFINQVDRIAFVGDVLFKSSIGRTDFPGGNYDDLIDSIQTKLLPLGDDMAFVSGHGPMSTFGYEKQTNPFLK